MNSTTIAFDADLVRQSTPFCSTFCSASNRVCRTVQLVEIGTKMY